VPNGLVAVRSLRFLGNWVVWAIVGLWGILSLFATELFWHAIYGSAFDWLKEHFADQTAEIIAYVSAHTLPAMASAAICIIIYFLAAYHHSSGEDHRATAPPASPAPAPVLASQNNAATPLTGDRREEAICLKANEEFSEALANFYRQPLPMVQINENIDRDYAPHSVLYRSVEIRKTRQFMPLLDQIITSELELRKQRKIPFTTTRLNEIQSKFFPIIEEVSRAIVLAGYYDAERHVTKHQGFGFDYKLDELAKIRDELLIKKPIELRAILDGKLKGAMADSILAS
jgi:hypothetical protein